MGAWSAETFGNDTACDWAGSFSEAEDRLGFVRETLEGVLETDDDYLASDQGANGLAACEVLARLKGNWGVRDAYSENIDRWVEANPAEPPEDLVKMGLDVIDRVLTEPSELLELWEDAGTSEWRERVEDLRKRLSG